MNPHQAAKAGNVARLMEFLDRGLPIDAPDEHAFTALHWASRTGQLPIVQTLISRRANPNALNCVGDTPLHYATSEGHDTVVRLLLQAQANPNAVNKHGNTPLHYACHWRHQTIAQLLVQSGANINSPNRAQKTPLMLAGDRLAPILQQAAQQFAESSMRPKAKAAPVAVTPTRTAEEEAMALLNEVTANLGVDVTGAGAGAAAPMAPVAVAPAAAAAPAARADWEVDISEVTYGIFVARGAFGEVYKGEFRGTEVAIKQLLDTKMTPKALEEFKAEVNIMSKLRHPNVNLFMGACLTGEKMFLLTAFEARGSLYSVLHDPKVDIDWKMLVKMATDAARGMAYLHGHKPPIIHRDMKSLNLLVDENWVVKITDFGLTTAKEASSNTMTQCGTPQWMAPEVLRNEAYDFKADVFSFAIVLWEMATRQIPYEGMNPMQVGMKVLLEGLRPVIPGYVPKMFQTLITDCWQTEAIKRPDFPEILNRLKRCG